jgi:hypothetical protein
MRILFLLLLLANAVFYAYAFVARERGAAETAGPELQINAEKIRIVKRVEKAEGSGAKVVSAVNTPAACLEWGIIAGPDVVRADAALARLELRADSVRRVMSDAAGYWVHIPALKNKAELDKKMSEVKAFGVTDVSAVQDSGLGRNAISLGIFSTEEAAQTRLATLKAKGVRSAVVEPREGIIRQARFFVREPGEDIVARLAELQREFPGSQIKAGQCPVPPSPAMR